MMKYRVMVFKIILPVVLLVLFGCISSASCKESPGPLKIGVFNVDATPPVGSPVAYAICKKILDPLSARGIVLLFGEKPVVLCAVDWIGISNGGYDTWREKLAEAAGTTMDHVEVHTLHQHDGPYCDFTTEAMLEKRGLGGLHVDVSFEMDTINRTAKAIQAAIKNAEPVTHIGTGKGKVEKVASNRRILGEDGKVKIIRWSKSKDPAAIAAPEGTIDPYVRLLSFWNCDKPLAVITYYATHPQSHYGKGNVSADFVGIARAIREMELPGPAHIHFNGAGGNVAAGKYNDGSDKMRPILAWRLAAGMRKAWASVKKTPITASDVEWRVRPILLPPSTNVDQQQLRKTLDDPKADEGLRFNAASELAWFERNRAGKKIDVSCLRLGNSYVLHMPGELFVEYQLAAQKLKPSGHVFLAAYGDYAPGYIGTKIAYSQGGYETGPGISLVAPQVEDTIMSVIKELLK